MRVLRTLLFLAVVVFPAQALMQAYSVEPVKALWSGWTEGEDGYVSQTVTCNWDSIVYCELFAGDTLAGEDYAVDVYEVGGGVEPVARNLGVPPAREHAWLKLELTTETGYSFTKGKTYEFRFTRSGSDSIQYYWDGDDPYKYGVINDADPNAARDLCMRCYGLLDPVDSTFWGMNIPSVC